MLHAYCVRRTGQPGPDPGVRGLDGAPVHLLEEGPLGLWYSPDCAPDVTASHLREHDRVVREALRTATPLPIRFGAGAFTSEADARRALAERADQLGVAIDRLAGTVEMGIRVAWTASAPDPPGPAPGADRPAGGRAYLEARREALRAGEAVRLAANQALDRVERAMEMGPLPSVRTLLPSPDTAGIVAHLVRRGDEERYVAAVAAAREALPDLRIAHSGPWAPYSFS